MENFIEGALELIFSFIKHKPKKRPNVELKEEFIVSYNKVSTLIILTLLFLAGTSFLALSFFMPHDTNILFYIFSSLFFIIFFLYLFIFSIRCTVTTAKILKTTLFFFKKEISWNTILCVRTIENEDIGSITIALYNYNKICVLDVSTDMENAWHIVKMAESKNIEIREEKNITIKQMKRL